MPSLKTRNLFISHVWDYSSHYDTVVDWFDNANNFSWKNYSVPIDKPIDTDSEATKREKTKKIKEKITNKINLSHGIIILGGMYVNHSDWIDYELDEAVRLGKPIIGVKPWGNERMPVKITNLADEVVNWQSSSVITAVRDFVRV